MSKFANGEYMSLSWDGKPDAYYIMGHVTHDEGIEILQREGIIDNDTIIGRAEHIYGRWSIETDEHLQMLREYSSSGRGRFKITMFGLGIFAEVKKQCDR